MLLSRLHKQTVKQYGWKKKHFIEVFINKVLICTNTWLIRNFHCFISQASNVIFLVTWHQHARLRMIMHTVGSGDMKHLFYLLWAFSLTKILINFDGMIFLFSFLSFIRHFNVVFQYKDLLIADYPYHDYLTKEPRKLHDSATQWKTIK